MSHAFIESKLRSTEAEVWSIVERVDDVVIPHFLLGEIPRKRACFLDTSGRLMRDVRFIKFICCHFCNIMHVVDETSQSGPPEDE